MIQNFYMNGMLEKNNYVEVRRKKEEVQTVQQHIVKFWKKNWRFVFLLPFLLFLTTANTTTATSQFPTGQRKALKKGEKWDVKCMEIELSVREIIIQTGEKPVNFGKQVTVTCVSANNAKAYYSCPPDAEAGGDPPFVSCD